MSDLNYFSDFENLNLSPGEAALIHYKKLSNNTVFNKVISAYILRLHLKNFIILTNSNDNTVLIEINKNCDTNKLKEPEKIIFSCLCKSDLEQDKKLTLHKITRKNNQFFSNVRKQLNQAILKEAIEDNYISEKSLKKRKFIQDVFIIDLTLFLIVGYYLFSIVKSMFILGLLFYIIIIAYIVFRFIMFKIKVFTKLAKDKDEKLKELESFFNNYSLIDDKKVLDVYLWEDYLVFAVILGVNDIVDKLLKVNLNNEESKHIDLDVLNNGLFVQFFNDISKVKGNPK